MAVDDAGLAKAEVHLAPGDVEWNEDLGRFKARVEQLLMGDVKHLPGLIPLLPNPKAPGFDAAVQSAFEAFASTWRQEPLLRARDVETTDGGVESDAAEVAGPAPALPPPQAPGAPGQPVGGDGGSAGGFAAAPQSPLPATTKANRKRPVSGSSGAGTGRSTRARTTAVSPASRASTVEPPAAAAAAAPAAAALAPAEQPSCDLAALVTQLQAALATVPLDEAAVGAALGALEGSGLAPKELLEADATKLVNRLRKSRSASDTLKARAEAIYQRWEQVEED